MQDIVANRDDRMSRRKQQRKMQTEQFIKSMQMLQANERLGEGIPFEDYSIYLYRQTAANFEDRVKELENKLLYPVRNAWRLFFVIRCSLFVFCSNFLLVSFFHE